MREKGYERLATVYNKKNLKEYRYKIIVGKLEEGGRYANFIESLTISWVTVPAALLDTGTTMITISSNVLKYLLNDSTEERGELITKFNGT